MVSGRPSRLRQRRGSAGRRECRLVESLGGAIVWGECLRAESDEAEARKGEHSPTDCGVA